MIYYNKNPMTDLFEELANFAVDPENTFNPVPKKDEEPVQLVSLKPKSV